MPTDQPTPPADPSATPAARLVAGRYRLGAVLGRGSMGTVWAAQDEVLGRPVAIKEVLLPPGIPEHEADRLRERSLREARAIAALSHPNVVTLYDVAREGKAPFVVMELVASNSLAELLVEGPVAPDRTATIGVAVAAALQAAHAAGITHRDVKPGNVLVAHDGRIKLTDFGIARNPADQTMTASGLMLGSPAYIAPEVASGERVSPAADLWGLGATLFAAVEGRPPYDSGDPLATVSAVVLGEVPAPSCTGPLAEVISGLMVKDPAARMPLTEVRRILGPSEPVTPAPARPAPAPGPEPAAADPVLAPPPDSPVPPGEQAPSAEQVPSGGQLAADPGPLPFTVPAEHSLPPPGNGAPKHRHPTSATRTVVVWTLAVLLFLVVAGTVFAAARLVSGAPVVPDLGAWTDRTGDSPELVTRTVPVAERDGSQPGQFTVEVPQNWPEFHDHEVRGDSSHPVVRFVSPDGSQVLTVERVTSAGGDVEDLGERYLNSYRRQIEAGPAESVEMSGQQRPDGTLDVTVRSRDGNDNGVDRTTYLRLVPDGPRLWVLRVTVPTQRETAARTELFEPVVATFEPGN